jgi:hypothetical protein
MPKNTGMLVSTSSNSDWGAVITIDQLNSRSHARPCTSRTALDVRQEEEKN